MKLWYLNAQEPFITKGYDAPLVRLIRAETEEDARTMALESEAVKALALYWLTSEMVSCVEVHLNGPAELIIQT